MSRIFSAPSYVERWSRARQIDLRIAIRRQTFWFPLRQQLARHSAFGDGGIRGFCSIIIAALRGQFRITLNHYVFDAKNYSFINQ